MQICHPGDQVGVRLARQSYLALGAGLQEEANPENTIILLAAMSNKGRRRTVEEQWRVLE